MSDMYLKNVHFAETYETNLEGWNRHDESEISKIFEIKNNLAYKCNNPDKKHQFTYLNQFSYPFWSIGLKIAKN